MCGIAGIVGVQDSASSIAGVQTMVSSLARRGPDSEGVELWDGAVLGHRRLAIFDLSDAGKQPMLTPDRRLGVVFNGAIYNYRALRDELLSVGRAFASHSDTEVLLHGYAVWGIDRLVDRLRGMFAFALWDNEAKRLYLVRDRLGVKPLVYNLRGSSLVFASTVRALSVAGFASTLHDDSIAEFLDFGFLPDDRCIYQEVRKVPAASIVEWSNGRTSTRIYWQRPSTLLSDRISFPDAVEETRRMLLDAVEVRLHADVPVGALLSGGIDSSLVCWAIQELGGDATAYTIGTPGHDSDETADARKTAERLHLKHCVVEMSDDDSPQISDLVSAYAEPFGTPSALGMLRVCRAISRSSDVKVLLTGDGGDDVFLGYPRHRHLWLADRLRAYLPPAAAPRWAQAARWIPRVGPLRRARAFLQYTSGGLDGVIDYSTTLQRRVTDSLVGDRLSALRARPFVSGIQRRHRTVLGEFLDFEFKTRFVGEYMTKVDGAAMHYGIEARAPFLDQHLWEFASSIPFDIRLHRARLKAILRRLAREEIGGTVARRRKRGFSIPVQHWIVGRWKNWVECLLRDSLLEKEGWIRRGAGVEALSRAIRGGSAPLHLWYVITLEAWLQHEHRKSV